MRTCENNNFKKAKLKQCPAISLNLAEKKVEWLIAHTKIIYFEA